MTESDKQKIINDVEEITCTFRSFLTSENIDRKSSYIAIIKGIIDDLQKFTSQKNKSLKDDSESIKLQYDDIEKRIEKLLSEKQLVKKRKLEDDNFIEYFSSIIQILETFESEIKSVKLSEDQESSKQIIERFNKSFMQLNDHKFAESPVLNESDYEPIETPKLTESTEISHHSTETSKLNETIEPVATYRFTKRVKSKPCEVLNGTTYFGGGLQKSSSSSMRKEEKMFNIGNIIKYNHIFYCIVSVKNTVKKLIQKHYELKLMAVSPKHIKKNSQGQLIFTPFENPTDGQKYVCIFLETREHFIYKQNIINSFELIDTVDYVSTFVYGYDENKLSIDKISACDKNHEYFVFDSLQITESNTVSI